MARALTTRKVETTTPAKQRQEIPDGLLKGLYLVVQPSGQKSWAVRYRHVGWSRKFTLGAFPAIDLKSARDLGAKALRAAAEGRDPGQEKLQARSSMADSVDTLVAQFIERHCKRANRPRTAQETERLIRSHVLPRWRGRTVRDITRREVLDVLDRVIDGGAPIAANRVLSATRKFFNWCVERDIVPSSPCAGVKSPTAERSRDRVLSDSELALVWKAADAVAGPFGSLVKLLILTGQRRDEVARMEWAELDLEARLWALRPARVKNNEQHEVPLSEPVVAIIKALPRIRDSAYVLTTSGTCPASNYSKGKRYVDALLPADMPQWRLHDLRRSTATGLARLGVDLPVIEKVLNHSSGSFAGVIRVYQRHRFEDEKRAALEAWGRFVVDLVNDKRPAKVVALEKGAIA
jgi:integrase